MSGVVARDIVWFDLADKRRPGVVLEVRDEFVRVAYGASRNDVAEDYVMVTPESRDGRAFGLTRETHFYGENTCLERSVTLTATGRCSIDTFLEIMRVVEAYDAVVASTDLYDTETEPED